MQPTERASPPFNAYLRHAAIASAISPPSMICIAFAPDVLRSKSTVGELFQVFYYAAAITFPIMIVALMVVAGALFLVSLAAAKLARRPWVAYPTALLILPLAYGILVFFFGNRTTT